MKSLISLVLVVALFGANMGDVNFTIDAVNNADTVLAELKAQMAGLVADSKKLGDSQAALEKENQNTTLSFSDLGKGLLTAAAKYITVGAAIAGTVKFVRDSIKAAAESETAMTRLEATLKATGRESEISAGQIDKIAGSLMNISAFDDEAIVGAYNALAKFESIPTGNMEQIIKTAMDMSAAMGGDLASNAEMIGRVLETGTIPRTWGFSAALKAQIQDQIKAGDTAGALTATMEELNKRYGGQAAAQLDTYAGAAERVKIAWAEILESNGQTYLQDTKNFNNWLANFLVGASKYSDATHKFSTAGPMSTYAAMLNYADALEIAAEEAKVLINREEDLIRVGNTFISIIENQDGTMTRLGNTFKTTSEAEQNALNLAGEYKDIISGSVPSLQEMAAKAYEMQLAVDGSIDYADSMALINYRGELGLLTDAEVEAYVKALNFKSAIDALQSKHITITIDMITNLTRGMEGMTLPTGGYAYPSESSGGGSGTMTLAPWATTADRAYAAAHPEIYAPVGHAHGGNLFANPAWSEVGEQGSEGVSPRGDVIPHQQWERMKQMGLVPGMRFQGGGNVNPWATREAYGRMQTILSNNRAIYNSSELQNFYTGYHTPTGWSEDNGASPSVPSMPAIQQSVESAVQSAMSTSASMQAAATAPVSQAAIKISESGEKTTRATQMQTQQNNQGNQAIIERLMAIETLLDRNFSSMPRQWAAAQARSVPV